MWADLATIGGAILLVVFLLIVAGIALCARYDRQYLGVDDEVHS